MMQLYRELRRDKSGIEYYTYYVLVNGIRINMTINCKDFYARQVFAEMLAKSYDD